MAPSSALAARWRIPKCSARCFARAAARVAATALLVLAAAAASAAPECAAGAPGQQPGRIIDLTVPIRAGMPVWEQKNGLPRSWRALSFSQDEGDVVNQSHLNLDAHTGTHIDAPRHFLPGAATLEQLPLSVLTGHADVIAVPHDTNVTAAALAGLAIPQDAERLLFKTLNTERWLMRQTPFASDYVGLDSSAAAWLAAERPGVALVGIDYLSIGMLEDIVEAHKGLFRKGTVVVEGLDLSAAPPGRHHLTCLPLLLEGSDGAPARCILQLAGDTAA